MTPAQAWARLHEWMGTLEDLAGAARMLEWDRETSMPAGASVGRGHQVATLHTLRHREVLTPGIDEVIDRAEESNEMTDARRAMIRLARRERTRAARIPESLVREVSDAATHSVADWLAHREDGNFAAFAPALARVVAATREVGQALDIGDEPYDGLLDEHEPGMRTAELEPLLRQLRATIDGILPDADDPPTRSLAERQWPDGAQFSLARQVAAMVGFQFDTGLVARSVHPFTTSPHIGDVRFTTRITLDDPTSNVLVSLHEAGHALYAQGHPSAYARTLAYASPSLGAEESQSRFYENHVGRCAAFWHLLAPVMHERFGVSMDGISPQDLFAAVTRVHRGWCRVDADELTYDLHIILRFELELAMIRGELQVADLPDAWRDGMQRLLAVTPTGDAQGCMQDIHWAWGSFGYFPTYTLGNIYAAQLAEAMDRQLGPIDEVIAAGDLQVITRFLQERVHRHGGVRPTRELMERATGQEFSVEPLVRRLTRLAAQRP